MWLGPESVAAHRADLAALERSPALIVQEFLPGDEYSIDVLADAKGLRGTSPEYRASASRFFRKHRDIAFIALINLGPVIHVVVEMFRVGTGIQLKTFADETTARAWLRSKGIAA